MIEAPSSESSPNGGNNNKDNNYYLVTLDLRDELAQSKIVNYFAVDLRTNGIRLTLNGKYQNTVIVSDFNIAKWTKTVDDFQKRLTQKNIDSGDIKNLCNTLDSNNLKITDQHFEFTRANAATATGSGKSGSGNGHGGFGGGGGEREQQQAQKLREALEFIKGRITELYVNEVKQPFAQIIVDTHVENVMIDSDAFKDWAGSTYYTHMTEEDGFGGGIGGDPDCSPFLSAEDLIKIQRALRFEANNAFTESEQRNEDGTNSKKNNEHVKKVFLRVAAYVDPEAADPDNNVIYYDLCNARWEYIKITRHGWSIEQSTQEAPSMFKRYRINNKQVYPIREYPSNILEQFMKLTAIYNNEEADNKDNKILFETYLISLFILGDLPKPVIALNGHHGSGKTTAHTSIKDIVDPSAAPITSFSKDLPELIQVLSHSYVTFFDNISNIKDPVSDMICRAVTGFGQSKRGLYTNDTDFIYNMMRAVGFNGINLTATRPDLLDRIINITFAPIDKRKRKKVKVINKRLDEIKPQLLGFILDKVVEVLSRLGEVKLDELPRMADYAEICELIARVLGYKDMEFMNAYFRNISYINSEAIEANPVATAIVRFIEEVPACNGFVGEFFMRLETFMKNSSEQTRLLLKNKNWPKTAGWFSNKLNEVIPNLKEMGIVIDRPYDKVRKAYTITMVRNEIWKSAADREKEATEADAKAEAASKEGDDRK